MKKEYIAEKIENQKACGCTEEQEKDYYDKLQRLKVNYDAYLVSIAEQ